MIRVGTRKDSYAYPVNRSQTIRTLEKAVRSQASIRLEPLDDKGSPILIGRITAQAPESFCLELTESVNLEGLELSSICCEATMYLQEEQYLFATNVMTIVSDDEPIRIEIARPEDIYAVQRRRFRRVAFRDTSSVRLSGEGDSGPFEFYGQLLNVSLAGMACKVHTQDSDWICIEERFEVAFQAGADQEWFQCEAHLRSKVPAGTPGNTIMGIEFAPETLQDEFSERLNNALKVRN